MIKKDSHKWHAIISTLALVWAFWAFQIFIWFKLHWWGPKEQNKCSLQIDFVDAHEKINFITKTQITLVDVGSSNSICWDLPFESWFGMWRMIKQYSGLHLRIREQIYNAEKEIKKLVRATRANSYLLAQLGVALSVNIHYPLEAPAIYIFVLSSSKSFLFLTLQKYVLSDLDQNSNNTHSPKGGQKEAHQYVPKCFSFTLIVHRTKFRLPDQLWRSFYFLGAKPPRNL